MKFKLGKWPPRRPDTVNDITEEHILLMARMKEGCECPRCLSAVRRCIRRHATPIYYVNEDTTKFCKLCAWVPDGWVEEAE